MTSPLFSADCAYNSSSVQKARPQTACNPVIYADWSKSALQIGAAVTSAACTYYYELYVFHSPYYRCCLWLAREWHRTTTIAGVVLLNSAPCLETRQESDFLRRTGKIAMHYVPVFFSIINLYSGATGALIANAAAWRSASMILVRSTQKHVANVHLWLLI